MTAWYSTSFLRGKSILLSCSRLSFDKKFSYDDQEALDKHMATPPVVTMMKALEKEDLVDTKIIRTTAGSAIKARI